MATEKKASISRYGHYITTPDGFKIPVGTTAQRDGAAQVGFTRLNTTTNNIEYRGDKAWEKVQNDLTFQTERSATFVAEVNRAYPVSTTSGTYVVKTPVDPKPGDRFSLFDSSSIWHVKKVTLQGSGSDKIERGVSKALDVRDDHAVFIYTGIASIGWLRENGGYPLVPVYAAISLKADQVYVDNLHNSTTHQDVPIVADTEATLLNFGNDTLAFKVLVHFEKANDESEFFEILVTRKGANGTAHTMTSEVNSGSSDVVIAVDFNAGLRLKMTSPVTGTMRVKVIWNVVKSLS